MEYERKEYSMLDIKFVRENKEAVTKNIKKKFQQEKLPLVEEVIVLDKQIRILKQQGDVLRQERNIMSDKIGVLFRDKKWKKQMLKSKE